MRNVICFFVGIFLIFSGCQNLKKREEKPREEVISLKKKIDDILIKNQEEGKIKVPEIPKISTPTKIKTIEKSEIPKYIEEIYTEELPVFPENIKFVNPEEISSEISKIFQNIYFDYDSYEIKQTEIEKLKIIGDYLLKNVEVLILIEGHCDERGTREYNLVLGEQRALSVRNFLINLGVSPKRLFTVSYGEDKPVVLGNNEFAWAKNRRCEFKIGVEVKK